MSNAKAKGPLHKRANLFPPDTDSSKKEGADKFDHSKPIGVLSPKRVTGDHDNTNETASNAIPPKPGKRRISVCESTKQKPKRRRPCKTPPKPRPLRPIHTHTERPEMKGMYDLVGALNRDMKTLKDYRKEVISRNETRSSLHQIVNTTPSEHMRTINTDLGNIRRRAIESQESCRAQISRVIMTPCELALTTVLESRFRVLERTCTMLKEDACCTFNSIKPKVGRTLLYAVAEECDIPFSVMKNSHGVFRVHIVASIEVAEIVSVEPADTAAAVGCTFDKSSNIATIERIFTGSTRGSAGDVEIMLKVTYTTHDGRDTVTTPLTIKLASKVTIRTNDNQIAKHERNAVVVRVMDGKDSVSWARAANIAQMYMAMKAPRMQHLKVAPKIQSSENTSAPKGSDPKETNIGESAANSYADISLSTQTPQTKRAKLDASEGSSQENGMPSDANELIATYRQHKRDYLSYSDYEVLKRLFVMEGKDEMDEDAVCAFIEVIMAFVSSLKSPTFAYLWNSGRVAGFMTREMAERVTAATGCAILRLSKMGYQANGKVATVTAAGELGCDVRWVISTPDKSHVQLNSVGTASLEDVAEMVNRNSHFEKVAFVAKAESNFLEVDAVKKFLDGEGNVRYDNIEIVNKDDLFDVLDKNDGSSSSLYKEGYIDLNS